MLAILPVAILGLLTLSIRTVTRNDWREAALLAALGWGTLVTGVTEGLSALGVLRSTEVAAAHVTATLILAAFLVVRARQHAEHTRASITEQPDPSPWTRLDRVLIAYLVLVVLVTGVTAVMAPPNMYDLLTYHMSRVVHWMQNGSLDHYPTHILRQLFMNPWASYAALQFQLLTGGDRFANIVAWLAMIGSVAGCSLIARTLGATRRIQLWTMVICASIPGGIIEAASGQTDYVVAFWLVCFAWAVIRVWTSRAPELSSTSVFVLGASLGLAVLTKGTAYLFAFPLLVWLSTMQLRRQRARSIPALVGIAVIALTLNVGFYARNVRLFGDPVRVQGTTPDIVALNADLGVRTAFLGLVRQASLHVGSPYRLRVQPLVERGVRGLHRMLGVDPDDPRLSSAARRFEIQAPTLGDGTGNNLHFALLLGSLLMLFVRRRNSSLRTTAQYAVFVMAGFFIFAYLFKWHVDLARLHLPIFVLASPIIAVTLTELRAPRLATLVVLGLAVASLPWLFFARSRPIIPLRWSGAGRPSSILTATRTDLYYLHRVDVKNELEGAARFIRSTGCREVGLIEEWNDVEYPLWIALGAPQRIRIHHVLVTNASSVATETPFPQLLPCAIIARGGIQPAALPFGHGRYDRSLSIGRTSVFLLRAQR